MLSDAFYLKQMEIGPMQNFVYLLGDKTKRECVVVDPAWDVDEIVRQAHQDDMTIVGGLITHTHFDHCNGAEDLIAQTQSPIYVHKNEAGFLKKLKSEIKQVESGDKLKIGSIEITFVHTPGHTPGSQCFLIQDHLVSGDTLFINACGRCDLPGGDASQLYESLQRLSKLKDQTVLLPGHNYADDPVSTIGREKQHNPYYQCHSLSDFLAFRVG